MILEVNGISKSFKENKVLENVTFKCKSGSVVGIIGYNGCGKTVLFKCICGFLKVDQGEIILDEKRLKKDFDILPHTGILIEEPAFLKNCSGIKNLRLLYMINHKFDSGHIRNVMAEVGLDAGNLKKVGKYSLGMRQRLAIAQAIMENPEILILDEPMNGLDKQGVADMRKLLTDLKNENKIILLASHNKEDIDILCDTVYEIDQGRILQIK